MRNRMDKKLRLREYHLDKERRYLEKRSELNEVLEEVFDQSTLMTLYELMNRGLIDDFYGVISSGKESRIYHARSKQGEELSVKIYLVNNAEFRKTRFMYVAEDPRFKSIPTDLRDFIYLWAKREYHNLMTAYEHKVPVPRPHVVRKNVLIMSFLGRDGGRYPLLREVRLTPDEYITIYEHVINYVKSLYRDAGLVHADLSEYNIMVTPSNEIYFIDLSQAVHRKHPKGDELLFRDISNVNRYFNKVGVKTIREEELFREITGRDWLSS